MANAKGGSSALDAWYRKYAEREMKDVKFCLAFVHDPGSFHSKTKKIVTPAEARGGFNIRFNDLHTPASLVAQIDEIARAVMRDKGAEIAVTHATSGISFLTKPGAYTELLSAAVSRVTGYTPEQSTSGGTSRRTWPLAPRNIGTIWMRVQPRAASAPAAVAMSGAISSR